MSAKWRWSEVSKFDRNLSIFCEEIKMFRNIYDRVGLSFIGSVVVLVLVTNLVF